MVRGNRQSGTTGEPLGDSLVVRVVDRLGAPVIGAEVTWTAEVGGSVSPATSVTSSTGQAGTQRMLGTVLGTYVTTAELLGIENAPEPAVFLASGVAARLALAVAPPAAAVAGVPLSPQPVLQLQDADGGDVAREGVAVTAQISSGDGTLAGTTTVTSDASGLVTFTDLAIQGPPGTRILSFTADGFASASAAVAVGVGAPAAMEAAADDAQSAPVATAVAVPPAVLVRDANGNPLAGIPVTFRVTGGGGQLTGATPVTGADGVATVGGWTLGQKAGANTVAATLSGLDVSGSPVTFGATATPGAVDAGKSEVSAAPRGDHRVERIEPEHDHRDRARRVRQSCPRRRRHPLGHRGRERADPAGAADEERRFHHRCPERDRAGRPRRVRHDRGHRRSRRPRR